MGLAEIFEAFKAIAALPEILNQIKSSIDQMRESALQKEMEQIKSEVNEVIKNIESAQSKEDRLALSARLARIISK